MNLKDLLWAIDGGLFHGLHHRIAITLEILIVVAKPWTHEKVKGLASPSWDHHPQMESIRLLCGPFAESTKMATAFLVPSEISIHLAPPKTLDHQDMLEPLHPTAPGLPR